MLAVVLVNTLIFATTVFLAFFNGADSITIYCAVVLMFLTQIANQFLFADHNRLKYIKPFANLQQIKKTNNLISKPQNTKSSKKRIKLSTNFAKK